MISACKRVVPVSSRLQAPLFSGSIKRLHSCLIPRFSLIVFESTAFPSPVKNSIHSIDNTLAQTRAGLNGELWNGKSIFSRALIPGFQWPDSFPLLHRPKHIFVRDDLDSLHVILHLSPSFCQGKFITNDPQPHLQGTSWSV